MEFSKFTEAETCKIDKDYASTNYELSFKDFPFSFSIESREPVLPNRPAGI